MKLFNRFPRWLRFSGLAVFVALCVGVNAIAFTEIHHSLNRRQPTPAERSKTTIKISPTKPATPATSSNRNSRLASTNASSLPTARTPINGSADAFSKPTDSFISTTTPTNAVQPRPNHAPKYGHRPYPVENLADMVQVASYPEGKTQRSETLHPEAAKALMDMIAAARADGIWLVPASGFRTIAQQRTLFNNQTAKRGSPEAAAKTSAPPGYSEHHTGYAIDLADGTFAQNKDISPAFEASPAYQWLTQNAANHGFELSFPKDNPQGIAFEAWHWRYIGSPQAKATFEQKSPPTKVSGGTERILE